MTLPKTLLPDLTRTHATVQEERSLGIAPRLPTAGSRMVTGCSARALERNRSFLPSGGTRQRAFTPDPIRRVEFQRSGND